MYEFSHVWRRNGKTTYGGNVSFSYGDDETVIEADDLEKAKKKYFLLIKSEMLRDLKKLTFEEFFNEAQFGKLCAFYEVCYQFAENDSDYCDECEEYIKECESEKCNCRKEHEEDIEYEKQKERENDITTTSPKNEK